MPNRIMRTVLIPVPKDPRLTAQALFLAKSPEDAQRAHSPDPWLLSFEILDEEWGEAEAAMLSSLQAAITTAGAELAKADSVVVGDSTKHNTAQAAQTRALAVGEALITAAVFALGDRHIEAEGPTMFLKIRHEPDEPAAEPG